MTNPSRSLSKGRLALSGSSFLRLRARAEVNPATQVGVITASAPPQTIRSVVPYWMARRDSPTAWLPAAQAVVTDRQGPQS